LWPCLREAIAAGNQQRGDDNSENSRAHRADENTFFLRIGAENFRPICYNCRGKKENIMKMGRALTLTMAAAGLLAFAAPAHAQARGGNRGGGTHAGGGAISNHAAFHRGDGDHDRDDRGHGRFFGRRGGVNVFIGGGFYGWPYWGPYWGYPYYYAPYGYYYAPPPYYQGEPAGVYNGRVINNDGAGKDASVEARVQQRLARAGYYHGPIDGVVGEGTRRAIRSYERDNGLHADGEIDRQLLATMGLS
jgi:hypothetical protein